MEPENYIKDLDDDTKDIENNGDGDVVLLQVDRLSISKLEPEIHKDFEGKWSIMRIEEKNIIYNFSAVAWFTNHFRSHSLSQSVKLEISFLNNLIWFDF